MHVNVHREGGEEQAGQAADREQADEPQRVEHRRLERDRPLVQRGRPVEHLDGRRHRHQEAQDREDHRAVHRHPGDEHVVAPHQEAEHGDRQAREGDERVAEDVLAREGRDQLADHAHRRQDHDVDGRVRVEPEQVLEQDRVAAVRRVEDPDVQRPLQRHGHQRDRQHRGAEHVDQAGRVHRPDEQRQAEPGQPRRPHRVDRDDEVQPGQDRGEPDDEDADGGHHHVAVRRSGCCTACRTSSRCPRRRGRWRPA